MTAVKLTLLLDQALGDAFDAVALSQAAQTAAQSVCDRLGLPAVPTLTLERAALPHGLAALRVDNVLCRHADNLESQLFAAQRGALYMPSTKATVAAWLTEQPERIPLFFSAFVRHVLSDQAASLLTEPVLAAYRDQLPEPLSTYSLELLHRILAPLLTLRVSLRDVERVAHVLLESPDERSEALFAALRPQRLPIFCSEATLRALTESATENERALFDLMRDGIFHELGVSLPSFAFAIDDDLPFNQFSLQLNDLPSVAWQGLGADQVLVNATADQLRQRGIPAQPAYATNGRQVALAHSADADAIRAEGFYVWTPFGHLVLNVSALLRQHSALFMCQSAAQRMLEQVALAFPALAESARERITSAVLARLLRALLAEGVSVRNMRLILEAIIAYDYVLVPSEHLAFDARLQVSAPPNLEAGMWAFVRTRLSRQLTQQVARERTPIPVHLIAPELEVAARESPEQAQVCLLSALRAYIAESPEATPVVLTTADARPAIRALIGVELPQVRVLAYQELVPEVAVQPVARLGLNEA
ncbi:MAG: FHIPEP family type III secretion protein [Anaerolineae bacterium]|nr:FHIPEP family type III secretion protein [Anaerolineae bacterium]